MNAIRTHPVVDAINALMRERGINRSELARRLGWERMRVVRRLTPGEHATDLTLAELEEIASVLGVPLSQLLPLDSTGAAQ